MATPEYHWPNLTIDDGYLRRNGCHSGLVFIWIPKFETSLPSELVIPGYQILIKGRYNGPGNVNVYSGPLMCFEN